MINKRKRFQECNKVQKAWRYIWYLTMPFLWVWYTIMNLKVFKDEIKDGEIKFTDESFSLKRKQLWKVIKGTTQLKMNWYYTSEEVKRNLNEFKRN